MCRWKKKKEIMNRIGLKSVEVVVIVVDFHDVSLP